MVNCKKNQRNVMKYLVFLLALSTQVPGNTNLSIDHAHLNELVGDNEAAFKPVAIEEENIDPNFSDVGARKRVVITYSQITHSDISSSYTASGDGNSTYNLYSEEINEAMKDGLELTEGHVISVEYLVTSNFSIELSDTYRKYNMEGRQVGFVDGGLFGDDQSVRFDNQTELHDIQIGAKYAINIIDTPNIDFDISPKASVGLVHVNSKSTTHYGINQSEEEHFNDIGGYSYGVGLEAKVTFLDNFFVKGSAEYRNYVMAPMEHDSGASQQINQNGLLVYFGVGIQF